MQNAEENLIDRLFKPKKQGDIPYIMCRRNFKRPPQGSVDMQMEGGHRITDYQWQGLKKVIKAGRPSIEEFDDFALKIHPNGECAIPDTPANRARLEMFKQKAKVTEVSIENGKTVRKTVQGTPEYERIETSTFEEEQMDRLLEKFTENEKFAEKIAEKIAEKKKKPEKQPVQMDSEPEKLEPMPDTVTMPKKRGRPKKEPVADANQ